MRTLDYKRAALWGGGAFVLTVLLWQGWKNYQNSGGGMLSNIASGALSSPESIAVNFLKTEEGWRPYKYTDSAGYATIGWGHKIKPGESFPAMIDQTRGEKLLAQDVADHYAGIRDYLPDGLNNNQIAACISFAFNEGITAFLNSTLLKKLQAGDMDGAVAEFAKWNKAHVGGQLVVVDGLTNRRAAEVALFTA